MTESSFQPSSTPASADRAVPSLANSPAAPSVWAFLRSYLTPAGKQALWNLAWLVAGTVVSQACGLVGVLLLTHALSPEQFGIYTFSMTLYGYLALVAAAGMGPVVIREVTRRPQDLRAITAAYITVSLAASILIAAVTWLGVWLAGPSADERFLLACIVLANLANCVQLLPFLDAHHRQSSLAMVTSVVHFGWLTAMLVCFATRSLTLRLAGVLIALRIVCLAAGALTTYQLAIGPIRLRAPLREVAGLLGSSWSLLITQLAATIPLTSGVLLVRWFHGEAAAGIMGLATLVLQTFLQLTVVAIRIVYPHITGPHGREARFRKKLWTFFITYESVLFVAITSALWLVVTCFVAELYAPVFPIGAILLCGGIPLGFVSLKTQFFIADKHELPAGMMQIFTSAIFLLIALLFIPDWSFMGAGIAFVVSMGFHLTFMLMVRRRLCS